MQKKIAIITGGNRGLGRSTAIELARKKVNVLLTYRTHKDEAEDVVREIQSLGGHAVALELNVANVKSFKKFYTEVINVLKNRFNATSFNFLINNAGIGIQANFMETTEAQFDELLNVHLKGVFFLTQTLAPLLTDGGRILNISSGLTRFTLTPFITYASMKGAIEVFSRYLAKELGPRRISVNVIAPGAIETDFGGGFARDNKDINAFISSQTALGRVGLPEDIGEMIASILVMKSGWINAQRIEASGGAYL